MQILLFLIFLQNTQGQDIILPHEIATIKGFSPYYLAGEKLNLSAFVEDFATKEATTLSVPLYVELIDLAQGEIIKRFILKLESGEAALIYTLPINLKTGNYQIRAYTNFMRNFGQSGFFKHNFTIFSQNYQQEIPSSIEQIIDSTSVIFENIETETGNFAIEKGLSLKGTIEQIRSGKPNKKEIKLAVIFQEVATGQKNTQHLVANCQDKFVFENLEFYGKQSITFIVPNNQVRLDTTFSIPKIVAQNLPINWHLISKAKEELQKRKEIAVLNHTEEEMLKNIILNEVVIKDKKSDITPKQVIPPYYTMKEREIMTWTNTNDLLAYVRRFRCSGLMVKYFINNREISNAEFEYLGYDVNTSTLENVLVFRDAAAGAYGACDCAIVLKQRYGNTFSMKKPNEQFVVEGYYR